MANPAHHQYCNCICTDENRVVETINKIADLIDIKETWKEDPTVDQLVTAIAKAIESLDLL